MKKLLIITDSFAPRWDGVTRFLLETVPSLAQNWDITVIAPEINTTPSVPIKGIRVIRFPTLPFSVNDFPIAKPINLLPYAVDADLIFVQSLSTLGMCGIFAAKKAHKPVIAYTHVIEWELVPKSLPFLPYFAHVFVSWLVKKIIRYFYNQCTAILVPTTEMHFVLERERIFPVKTLVPLGVNTRGFIPPQDKRRAKTAIGLSPENIVIGYCGRLSREKSLGTLHTAFIELQKQYKHITLLIVGKGLAEETALFAAKENIVLVGSVDNPVPYFQAMDIFVLPSLTETTSLATLEASSCGVPVVSTPVGAMKEFLVDGENGFLFPKKNVQMLKKKLEWLIANQKGRMKLGEEGRKTVIERYSLDKTIARLKAVLNEFKGE